MSKPYRQGPVGALVDEYERAVGELVRVLDSISDEQYVLLRDAATEDEDCRSIQTIVRHVIGSGHGYAGMLRDAWGIPRGLSAPGGVARSEAGPKLREMLAYTSETLSGRWEISAGDMIAMRMPARWGPVYDLEQLFEHAIVHVLRHRRQIERFLDR